MQNQNNFPDLPAWQKLRAELEPFQTNNQINNKIVIYIDRIIHHYDNPTIRQLAFEELIDSLEVTTDLINKILFALSIDLPSTSSTEQQAREILLQWLPDRLIAFSILEVDYKKVIRENGSEFYLQRGVDINKRLKNWFYFSALTEWQKLQSQMNPYRNNPIDKPIIMSIDKAEENYLQIQQFILHIEGISYLMMPRRKMQYILTGSSTRRSRDNALKTLWAEKRLKSWLRKELANFKPSGQTATKSLENWISKHLNYRISNDFKNYLRYQSKGAELSLDAPLSDDNDSTLYDLEPSPDLDQHIADLQAAEKAQRGFPIFVEVEFLKGLVNDLEAIHQNCWEVRFANYINQDPHHELRNTDYIEKACNYQYLLQNRTLPEIQGLPPKTITDICREFPAIGEHGLRSHIKRTFDPWVDSIYLEILTKEEWSDYRYYLENIASEDLTAKYRKGFLTCNIFFLAQHRLPCFTSNPLNWVELAEVISTKDGKKIRPEYVEKFWQEDCRPALGKIARLEIIEYKTA
jgi:hypothetical protein